jgi:glutamyl-tRNA reductase
MYQSFLAVGISHKRSPVEVRERIAFSDAEVRRVLERLKGAIAREALLVSTCNRTELYVLPGSSEITSEYLIDFLLSAKSVPHDEIPGLRSFFERYSYCDAIEHLFAVTAGVDSLMLGDQQIFSQVKEAFRITTEAGISAGLMTKLAHNAFHVAKRVKSETTLNTGAATISYAAVELARKIYDNFSNHTGLVIGAGETAELAAKYLVEKGLGTLIVANRTLEHADSLLRRVRGGNLHSGDRAVALTEVGSALSTSDIVISSTGAPGYVLTYDTVKSAMKKRSSSYPVVLLDIAVPRDIEPEVSQLSNVFLKDMDDLRTIIDQNLEKRKQEIPKAVDIIREEVASFRATISSLQAGPTIKELRDKFEAVRQEELDRHRGKVDERTFAMFDEMTRRILNRLLHSPIVTLKEPHASTDDLMTRVELIRKLFALDTAGSPHDEDDN